MANIIELTPKQQKEYDAWVASRPEAIQKMIATHPPTKLYALAGTKNRVTIHSYGEDGEVQVLVLGKYNATAFDRRVFGIKLSELTECDLPAPNEPVGTVFTDPEDVEAFVDATRPLILSQAQKTRLVKELHDKSGVGLMRAKMVLAAHNWNIDTAIKALLRESMERNQW